MSITTFFPMFLGLLHCFEADHVLAVASVSTKDSKSRSLFYQGVTWGVGHSIPILLIGIGYTWFNVFLLKDFPFSLEVIVGFMLVVVGVFRLIQKSKKEKLNNHVKAMLLVGLLHGVAGSAGVIFAHASSQSSGSAQLLYFLIFSIGSILGMGLINLLIGKVNGLLRYVKKIQWIVPLLSIGYGIFMIYKFI